MSTFADLEDIVQDNVNDSTADVVQPIDDAIDYLSNFFGLNKIDTSQDTAVDGTTLDIPTGSKKILSVKVGDDFIEKISISKIAEMEENGAQRFYEFNSKINFTDEFDSVEDTEIFYEAKFTRLAGVAAAVCDVPEYLQPLLVIYATYFYYMKMLATMATSRESYPDIEPEELRQYAKEWKETGDELLMSIYEKSDIV
ncbi:MAG: hypothetical protein RBS86_04805 [Candidatus Moranbacteria bacterium]|jgi:hypothetical protein|nr:hypothetical protein [Candidatus Moranbacteria bacterium]